MGRYVGWELLVDRGKTIDTYKTSLAYICVCVFAVVLFILLVYLGEVNEFFCAVQFYCTDFFPTCNGIL